MTRRARVGMVKPKNDDENQTRDLMNVEGDEKRNIDWSCQHFYPVRSNA